MKNKLDPVRKALHDVKQPLNVIRLTSANIRARLGSALDAEEAQYLCGKLDRIDEQVQRSSQQIEQLMASIAELD